MNPAPGEHADLSPFTRAMITVSVMLAAMMQSLDTTIANVALPHMQGALSAAQDQIAWVLTSYVVATAIGIPLAGWAAERYGRRTVLLYSIGGFVLASAACGAAETLPQIVLARLLQGLLGAGLMPLSQAVILDTYPPERMARGMAIWSAGVILGPIMGPTLGGLLTDSVGWRWVFYVNVPLGVLALLGIYSHVPPSRPNPAKTLDVFGFATVSLAIGLLQLMLDRGTQLDWFNSTEIRIEAAASMIAFSFFLAHTFTTGSASFFNKRLLSNASYLAGVAGYSIAGGLLSATRALLPSLLQNLYLFSALDAGLIMSPTGLGALLGSLLYARLAHRIDARVFPAFGFLMMAGSLWYMSGYNLEPGFEHLAWPGLLQGLGLTFSTLPLTTTAFATLANELRNEGSAVFNLVRNLGGSIAISLTQSVVLRHSVSAHAELSKHVTVYSPYSAPPYLPAPLDIHDTLGMALINFEIDRQAAMVAYVEVFKLMLLVALMALPLLLLIGKPPTRAKPAPVIAE